MLNKMLGRAPPPPPTDPPVVPAFRFAEGTQVLCRTGPNEWSAGTIVRLNYSEPDWRNGRTVPYQVKLKSGPLIFVPKDVEQLCRELVPPWWADCFKKSKSLYAEYNPKADALLEAATGKDVNEKDHEGNTALMEAVRKAWPNAVAQLLAIGADVDAVAQDESCAIHLAVEHGVEVVKLLVDARADLNVQDDNPDHDPEFTSATFGDRLEHRTPLHHACMKGDVDVVGLLLNGRADANIQDAYWKTPLHVAIDEGHDKCIDALLCLGVDTDLGNLNSGFDNSPLMDAASLGNTALVEKLIAARSDVNKQGKSQMSALHLAARSRRAPAAELLIAARADMDQGSSVGTALELARKNGGVDLLKVFGLSAPLDTPSPVRVTTLDAATRAALFLD